MKAEDYRNMKTVLAANIKLETQAFHYIRCTLIFKMC